MILLGLRCALRRYTPTLTRSIDGQYTIIDSRRFMATKRQQKIEKLQKQIADVEGFSSQSDVHEFKIDTTGLYQSTTHNFLPNFDDPKVALHYEEGTPLWNELVKIIGLRGPISVAEYFRYALLHPEHGYYTAPPSPLEGPDCPSNSDDIERYDLIGKRGDFTTAPEISQIFGELLCVWFVHEWRCSGSPNPIQLIELGPGNGTLIDDVVRVARNSFPDFAQALSSGAIHLVEQSPALRKSQAKKLGMRDIESETLYATDPDDPTVSADLDESLPPIELLLKGSIPAKDMTQIWPKEMQSQSESADVTNERSIPVFWHLNLASVPNEPVQGHQYMLAQELFDALPVHSFQKTANGWRERLVDIASAEEGENDNNVMDDESKEAPKTLTKKNRLRFVLSPGTTGAVRKLMNTDKQGNVVGENASKDDSSVGDILEVCPEGMSLAQDMTSRINKCGGGALIIDYGSARGTGDTIRSFSRHEQVHVLSQPGKVDVTADVDFRALAYAISQIKGEALSFGPVTQGRFLMSLGAGNRVEELIDDDNTTDGQAEDLYTAFERLVLPEHMGERFNVLAIAKKDPKRHCPPGFEN